MEVTTTGDCPVGYCPDCGDWADLPINGSGCCVPCEIYYSTAPRIIEGGLVLSRKEAAA